jgi:hypothetical protein
MEAVPPSGRDRFPFIRSKDSANASPVSAGLFVVDVPLALQRGERREAADVPRQQDLVADRLILVWRRTLPVYVEMRRMSDLGH